MKKQYKIYGLLLFMMKILPYSWLRKMMISISLKQIGIEDEAPEDKKYMEDLFRWVYSQYTKKFDYHLTSLIATVVDLEPFTKEQYDCLCHNALLVLPTDDKAFSDEAKKDLRNMMPYAKIKTSRADILLPFTRWTDMSSLQEGFLKQYKPDNKAKYTKRAEKISRSFFYIYDFISLSANRLFSVKTDTFEIYT